MKRTLGIVTSAAVLAFTYAHVATSKRALPATPRETRAPSSAIASPTPENSAHPRVLLTQARIERARRHAMSQTPQFAAIVHDCEQAGKSKEPSGYEAWDWGNRMAECALLFHATNNATYAATALRYLQALLDDRATFGDQKGGDEVVRHDSGYPIRTYGFYAALGYDWLHDAPGMTPELLGRTAARLEAWLDWYARAGYRRENPIANYFTGYFGALSTAGLAMYGERKEGDALLARAESLFAHKIVPAYAKTLAGGDWPEGWQYGDGAAVSLALFVDAEKNALGRDRLRELPWLGEVVRHHTHALLPDGVTAYDNGDWSERPTRMPSRALDVLSMVLPESDPRGKEARFLARTLRNPKDGWGWMTVLADDPGAPALDPRHGTPSAFLPGTGLVLARSGWNKDATFISFQCGPTVSDADHEHADQGHFEVARGADQLLVDASDYGALASVNHNTLLVDDHGDALDYAPNQGVWGTDMRIERFVDTSGYLYAEGDFTDAYRPSKLEWGKERSVLLATRALVYLRPETLVIYDRVRVKRSSYGVAWAVHALARPAAADRAASPGDLPGDAREFRVERGESQAVVSRFLPADARVAVRAEPTKANDGPYVTNHTYAPSFRVEVASPAGGTERRFLHVVRTGKRGETTPRGELYTGDFVDGVVVPSADGKSARSTLVVFPRSRVQMDPGGVTYRAKPAREHVLLGLEPGASYRVTLAPAPEGCLVSVVRGEGATADAGGTLLVRTESCGNP